MIKLFKLKKNRVLIRYPCVIKAAGAGVGAFDPLSAPGQVDPSGPSAGPALSAELAGYNGRPTRPRRTRID